MAEHSKGFDAIKDAMAQRISRHFGSYTKTDEESDSGFEQEDVELDQNGTNDATAKENESPEAAISLEQEENVSHELENAPHELEEETLYEPEEEEVYDVEEDGEEDHSITQETKNSEELHPEGSIKGDDNNDQDTEEEFGGMNELPNQISEDENITIGDNNEANVAHKMSTIDTVSEPVSNMETSENGPEAAGNDQDISEERNATSEIKDGIIEPNSVEDQLGEIEIDSKSKQPLSSDLVDITEEVSAEDDEEETDYNHISHENYDPVKEFENTMENHPEHLEQDIQTAMEEHIPGSNHNHGHAMEAAAAVGASAVVGGIAVHDHNQSTEIIADVPTSPDDDGYNYTGLLYKPGKYRPKKWKKRYFVLDMTGVLSYLQKPGSFQVKGSVRFDRDLDICDHLAPTDTKPPLYVFKVVDSNKGKLKLAAETIEDKQRWIAAFYKVRNRLRRDEEKRQSYT